MSGNFDYSRVDVPKMAEETGIDIFLIYETLRIPPHETVRRILNEQENASSAEEIANALMRRLNYRAEMGGEPNIYNIKGLTLSGSSLEDFMEVQELRIIEVPEETEEQTFERIRRKTGIAWGTPDHVQQTNEKAGWMLELDWALRLYESIPDHPLPEAIEVIRVIARRFFVSTGSSF